MSEIDFCRNLLERYHDFWEAGKAPYVEPFLNPVDEVIDNAPGYYATISEPMDLATMGTKLEGGRYNSAADSKADFDLMISNCERYNAGGPVSLTNMAERFVKDFTWEWEQMGKWRSKERRRLLKLQPAPAVQSAVSSGGNVSVASGSAIERSSRPSPELGSPSTLGNDLLIPSSVPSSLSISSKRPLQIGEGDSETDESPKRARVDESPEEAVDVIVAAMRRIMAQEIAAVGAEKYAEMEALDGGSWALFEKVWGPDRHDISRAMWEEQAFSTITANGWPNSLAAIRGEALAAWVETTKTQVQFLEEEEAAEAERKAAKKARETAEFLSRLGQ